ncbi:hypothetical protein [Lewinella sp. IMCC34191]|uniref:hypothetical protein n=1 Tax=Lewinella sp. IMCC34191 TaxID=2259172 RepID=UPI000E254EFB|nr:hypothetical protein [Lewinella sp. IMCC34191]
MKTFSLSLLFTLAVANISAQWSYSARTFIGFSVVDEDKNLNEEVGGCYGLGAQIAYDFGGRIGEVSAGLDYEQYRDFYVFRDFGKHSANSDPADWRTDINYRSAIQGWNALRLNVGVEGPFIVVADDGPLRMFLNGGLMITGAVSQYGATVILPDSLGNLPAEKADYTIYDGKIVDDGRQQSLLSRFNLFGGFGLAYRLSPTLSLSAMYEKSFGPIGRKYGGEYVDPFDGRKDSWEKHHFEGISTFRLAVNIRVF